MPENDKGKIVEPRHEHISLLERVFGKMSDRQRTRMQRKLGWACVWVLVCLGVALIISDEMLASAWQWSMGLF